MNKSNGRFLFGCTTVFLSIVLGFTSGIGGAFIGYRLMDSNPTISNGDNTVIQERQVVSETSAVVDVVDQVGNAVVSIIVTKDLPRLERYYYNPFGDDSFFGIPRLREEGVEERQIGAGSGFVVSSDGYIVTNRHVVDDEEASYTVVFNNGERIDAEVLDRDTYLDIAILKIDVNEADYLNLGDSDQIKIGQRAIAIGNALGEFQNSVSDGIISGLSRSITAGNARGGEVEQLDNIIQTDASINPGNSGGPLLDYSGNVIGVNVAVAQNAENIGFAIPINEVKRVVESVIEFGEIRRPYLGVRYTNVNQMIAEQNNLSVDYGALIISGSENQPGVIPNGPADLAGLEEGDVILEINGERIENNLRSLIQEYEIGEVLQLLVIRDNQELEFDVQLKALE